MSLNVHGVEIRVQMHFFEPLLGWKRQRRNSYKSYGDSC